MFAALLVLAFDAQAFASLDSPRLAQDNDGRLRQGSGEPRRSEAQAARLIVTVVDPSGAVIPGATVTITGLDDLTKTAPIAPAKTTDKGIAAIDGLRQGRYAIQAAFPGFETGTLKDVRVRRGDNKHVVVLAIRRMEESVDVAQDAQAAAADPRGTALKAVLTPEEVEALSDDPADMAQQLQVSPEGTRSSASTAFSARRCRRKRRSRRSTSCATRSPPRIIQPKATRLTSSPRRARDRSV